MKEKVQAWWKDNTWFFIFYLIFLSASFILLAGYDKKGLHLFLNRSHHAIPDTFFSYVTHLGDGYFAVFMFIVLLFYCYRNAILLLLSYGLSAGIVQLLKHYFFNDEVRPLQFFKGLEELKLVSGVDVHSYYSFPSGHATTAFVVFTCLAFFTGKRSLKLIFLALALLAAYSRVYLSQHFLGDITAGSIVGVTVSSLLYLFITGSHKLNSKTWLDKKISF